MRWGGGDEAYLARIFKEQEVKKYLQENLGDRVYVGISAGSVVAGLFMPKGINVELYGEECESDEGEGMEFFDFVYLPHLNSEYFPGVTVENIKERLGRFDSRVIATDDFTSIAMDGNTIKFVGTGVHWENQ